MRHQVLKYWSKFAKVHVAKMLQNHPISKNDVAWKCGNQEQSVGKSFIKYTPVQHRIGRGAVRRPKTFQKYEITKLMLMNSQILASNIKN